ncbi:hypothetical protein ACJX0J_020229, partial [Zea mays]
DRGISRARWDLSQLIKYKFGILSLKILTILTKFLYFTIHVLHLHSYLIRCLIIWLTSHNLSREKNLLSICMQVLLQARIKEIKNKCLSHGNNHEER